MAPQDTPWAQEMSFTSVSRVVNLLTSTTLSMPSSPREKAARSNGRDARAWAASIHRRAFQPEIP
jgi:hypothetical protein